jgi:hypothetical protein
MGEPPGFELSLVSEVDQQWKAKWEPKKGKERENASNQPTLAHSFGIKSEDVNRTPSTAADLMSADPMSADPMDDGRGGRGGA